MPIYNVTDELSGLTLELEGDSPPTETELAEIFQAQIPRERAKLQKQLAADVEKAKRLDEANTPGVLESAVRGAAQGTTFGFGDEVGAAVNAIPGLFTDEGVSDRYKRIRDDQRARNRVARQKNPISYIGGEIGGGLATGVSGAGRTAGAQTLRQASPQLAKIGALEGAVTGAGYSESDTLGGVAKDTAVGAGIGATIAPAVPALMTKGRDLIQSANNAMSRQGRAANTIRRDISADNLTPQSAQDLLDANPDAVLGDLGANLQQRLGGVANMPGSSANRARTLLEERNIEQLDRMQPKFAAVLGDRGSLQAARDSVQRTRDLAGPFYDEAYATPIRGTQRLQELSQTPAFKDAYDKAIVMGANREVDLTAPGASNVQLLDYVARGLRDVESVASRSGELQKASSIGNIRKSLLAEVDAQVPSFNQARRIAADEFSNRDALEYGQAVFRQKTPNLKENFNEYSQSEKEHFRIGVFDALSDRLSNKSETANLTQDFKKPKFRQAIEIAFDDPILFDQFKRSLGDEQQMFETFKIALTGSPTASRIAFQDQGADVGTMAADVATGGGISATRAGAGMLNRLYEPGRIRQANVTGDLLLSRNPVEMLNMLSPQANPNMAGAALPSTGTAGTAQILQLLNNNGN